MAGVLTQFNTSSIAATAAADDFAWDWGMGWGWSGYSASYCSTCAMEQAALMNSHIGQAAIVDSSSHSFQAHLDVSGHHSPSVQDYIANFDGDDELGDLGETADVGCDFGDFGFWMNIENIWMIKVKYTEEIAKYILSGMPKSVLNKQ